jgi:hypothetical protein
LGKSSYAYSKTAKPLGGATATAVDFSAIAARAQTPAQKSTLDKVQQMLKDQDLI